MRMPFFAELRWLIATKLIGWAIDLVAREASTETLTEFQKLLRSLTPMGEFETVRKQRT